MELYRVRVAGDDLTFSAGHFITLGGDRCEAVHGHDYRVAAEVSGPLDENQCVVDFVALRGVLAAIVGELDHRVLLPTEHAAMHVEAGPEEVLVTFAGRRWVFPRGDCVLLPLANTTSELLARHVARRLVDDLQSRAGVQPRWVRIEVAESHGQSATCEIHP